MKWIISWQKISAYGQLETNGIYVRALKDFFGINNLRIPADVEFDTPEEAADELRAFFKQYFKKYPLCRVLQHERYMSLILPFAPYISVVKVEVVPNS